MATAINVAKVFLLMGDDDAGDLLSNLKLQKLAYYAQGFHLALFDSPLFAEEIRAWAHGPVVPELYRAYKHHGSGPIPKPDEADSGCLTAEQIGLLEEVYKVYGQYSAWKLRNMTHEEAPWKDTPSGEVISHDALKSYFKTQLA
jgi:uncharacterized phage-associated protein